MYGVIFLYISEYVAADGAFRDTVNEDICDLVSIISHDIEILVPAFKHHDCA